MSSYGPCPFCGAHVMGWNATDGFHPHAHFCKPMVDTLEAENDQLRAELEDMKRHLNAAEDEGRRWQVACKEAWVDRDEWHGIAIEAQVQASAYRTDRDREIARLHDSIAMLESLPGNELARKHADALAEMLALYADMPHTDGCECGACRVLATYKEEK